MAEATITTEAIYEALKTVYDPEMPVDIYELGLIYDISFEEASPTWNPLKRSTGKNCKILMTLYNTISN